MSGGQVLNTYEVDNYPGLPGINGFDLGMKLREHADRLEAVFCTDEVRAIEDAAQDAEKDAEKGAAQDAEKDAEQNEAQDAGEDVLEAAELHPVSGTGAGRTQAPLKRVVGVNDTYLAKAVLIASGAMHSKLGVPGEERLAGMGVSYCATCDGAFFRNKVTAVVGGGDVAIEDAIFLGRMCRHVYLIHRRDALRGAKDPAGEAVRPGQRDRSLGQRGGGDPGRRPGRAPGCEAGEDRGAFGAGGGRRVHRCGHHTQQQAL